MLKLLIAASLFCACAFAQVSTYARRVINGASLPATCNTATGDIFFVNTGGSLGLYACIATNTWGRAGVDSNGNLVITGTITTGSGGGVSGKECLNGSNSGSACISVPATAGAPNDILLPTTSGTADQIMKGNGANPNQLAWIGGGITPGGYGAGDLSTIPQITLNASGLATAAASVTTAGRLKFIETGGVSNAAGTAAVSTATLCALANCVAGYYEVEATLLSALNCATPGPAIAGITIGWTDEGGAKTLKLPVAGVGLSGSDVTLGNLTSYGYARVGIRSTGAANITYAINYTACTTGTGTYATSIFVTRIQ